MLQSCRAVLSLASGHLSHAFGISWLCFLAVWAESWAKLYLHAAANFCHVTLASLDAWWPNSWEMWPEASNSTVLSGLGRVSMGFWQNIEKHAVKHRPSDQKLGIHSDFGPISRVDFKNWDPKYFGQPYCSYAIPRFAPDFRFQRRIGLTSWPRAHFNQLLAISGPWFGKTTLGQFWCWIGLYWFLHFYNQVVVASNQIFGKLDR